MTAAMWPRTLAVLLALALVFACGWYVRSLVADVDAADQARLVEVERAAHREYVDGVEEADRLNKAKSTAAVDAVEQAREVDIQVVDREVIKYVERYRTSACVVDPEWLCVVNRSLGLRCEG